MADWHVIVYDNTKKHGNILFDKHCIRVQEANDLIKKKKEEFPSPHYTVAKEKY